MPLERDYVVLLGPEPREFDGRQTRNVELQPCGCWYGEVWRSVSAPIGTVSVDLHGALAPVREEWCLESQQCKVHSAAAIVLQLQIGKALADDGRSYAMGTVVNGHVIRGEKLDGSAFIARLGDGSKRLFADAERVLAEAAALDQELRALGEAIPRKLLNK